MTISPTSQKKIKTQLSTVTPATPQYDKNTSRSSSAKPMNVRMMEQQNELLQQQLVLMQNNIRTLLSEKQNDLEKIQNLQQFRQRLKKRKTRKYPTHFDIIAKRIAKRTLFPMIKFVSKQDLDNYKSNRSIGYHFLQALKKENQVKDSTLFDGNDEVLWENAKHLVKEGLSEKRNARQTQIKKAWKGL